MTESSNGEDDRARQKTLIAGSDPHGRAALLLVESLLHGLIAKAVLPLGEAINITGIALDVSIALADEAGDEDRALRETSNLLSAALGSLARDAVAK